MTTLEFPFELRDSKFVPGRRSLAVKMGKVTYISPIESKPSQKTGEMYKFATLNMLINVPGATSATYLCCKVTGADINLIEEGKVKPGDLITCLLDLDIHAYTGKSYQDVNISEIDTLQVVQNA